MDPFLLLHMWNVVDLAIGAALVFVGAVAVRPIDSFAAYFTIAAGAVWAGAGACTCVLNTAGAFAPTMSPSFARLTGFAALVGIAAAGAMALRAAAMLAQRLRQEGGGR